MPEPISIESVAVAVGCGIWAFTVALLKREIARQDREHMEIRQALFGDTTSSGLRERVSTLTAKIESLDAVTEVLFDKLDKINAKLDTISAQLSMYHTDAEVIKANVISLESRFKDHLKAPSKAS